MSDENKIIEINSEQELRKFGRAKVVNASRYILQGQLENRVDMLTAMLLVHGAPQQVLDQVEALHKVTKELRQHLREEERGRVLAQQLQAALQERLP